MRQHGRFTQITVDSDDLSAYCTTSEMTRGGDKHDVTTYSPTRVGHVYDGGLANDTFTMSGIYETGASGPRAVLEPLILTVVEITRKPEGTGSGKPLETFQGLIEKYVETNPVADMVSWSCDIQVSDGVVSTTQA